MTFPSNKQDRDDTTWAKFSMTELRALYRILEHEFIPYDDFEAQATVRKISQYIKEHDELAQTDNGAA